LDQSISNVIEYLEYIVNLNENLDDSSIVFVDEHSNTLNTLYKCHEKLKNDIKLL